MRKLFSRSIDDRYGTAGVPRPSVDDRLDPVRWQRPGRRLLARWIAVAVLLSTAALVVWSGGLGAGSASSQSSTSAQAKDTDAAAGAEGGPRSRSAGSERDDGSAAAPLGAPGAGSGPPATGGTAPEGITGRADVPAGEAAAVPAGKEAAVPAGKAGAVPAGQVGVAIRLADPTALTLLDSGDRVELWRVTAEGARAQLVADDAVILEITKADDLMTGGLLIALTPAAARQAIARPGQGFAVLLRPR